MLLIKVRNAEFGMRSGGTRETAFIPHSALHTPHLLHATVGVVAPRLVTSHFSVPAPT